MLQIRQSKTDQYNQGTTRNHFRSGDPDLCVVEALAEYEEQDPMKFRGLGATQPLFTWEDGDPLQRSDLAGFIKLAVVAEGYQAADGDTHGLRIGGASALYAAVRDLGYIKRFGRWNSDAFHGYLWESHQRQEGLARDMVARDTDLLRPRDSDKAGSCQAKQVRARSGPP